MSATYASSGLQFGASEKLHARIIGIDVFRFFAIVGVVFIHASDKTTLGNAFDLASRFSVPFFFIVAGYFAGLRPDLSFSRTLRSVAKRIILSYLVWLSLYVVYSGYDLRQLTSIRDLASLLIYAGPGWHLWFLPSLAFGTLMLSIVGRSGELRSLVGLAVAIYLAGLAIGPYARIVFSVSDLGIHPRNGLFFGFPFMVLGYWVGRTGWNGWSFSTGALLYFGGLMHGRGGQLALHHAGGSQLRRFGGNGADGGRRLLDGAQAPRSGYRAPHRPSRKVQFGNVRQPSRNHVRGSALGERHGLYVRVRGRRADSRFGGRPGGCLRTISACSAHPAIGSVRARSDEARGEAEDAGLRLRVAGRPREPLGQLRPQAFDPTALVADPVPAGDKRS